MFPITNTLDATMNQVSYHKIALSVIDVTLIEYISTSIAITMARNGMGVSLHMVPMLCKHPGCLCTMHRSTLSASTTGGGFHASYTGVNL